MHETGVTLLAVSVGNTSTRFGRFEEGSLEGSGRLPNDAPEALYARILEEARALPEGASRAGAIVIASVNERVAMPLVGALRDRSGREVYRLGQDLDIPLRTALEPHATPGQDRLLNALAAFDRMKRACVVVDAGTAVTVDFIDGQGVFQGGAIGPGVAMSLHALHERTFALPHVHMDAPPSDDPFGRDTPQAMIRGVFWGIRGLVRALAERYAEAYEAYPPIVATGGDAALLFEGDDLIDRIVPDLTLMGIEAACRINVEGEGAGSDTDLGDDDA